MSMYSGSVSYDRGQTQMISNGNDYSAMNGHNQYEEPQVDVLANSRRAQLADALGQSGQK